MTTIKYHEHGGFYNDGNSHYWSNDSILDLTAHTITESREETYHGQLACPVVTTTSTRDAVQFSHTTEESIYIALLPLIDTYKRTGKAELRYASDKHRYFVTGRLVKANKLAGDSDYHGTANARHIWVLEPYNLLITAHWQDRGFYSFTANELITIEDKVFDFWAGFTSALATYVESLSAETTPALESHQYLFTDKQLIAMPFTELEQLERASWRMYQAAANQRDAMHFTFGTMEYTNLVASEYSRINRLYIDRIILSERLTKALATIAYEYEKQLTHVVENCWQFLAEYARLMAEPTDYDIADILHGIDLDYRQLADLKAALKRRKTNTAKIKYIRTYLTTLED